MRASFTWINRANVRSGVRLYEGRRLIIVDRLHAHILASLMGIDHVMLDNNYRKLGAVFDEGRTPDLGLIFTPPVLLPILGLACLALIPVVYRRMKGQSE